MAQGVPQPSRPERKAEARDLRRHPGVRAATDALGSLWARSHPDVDSLMAKASSVVAAGAQQGASLGPEERAAVSRLRSHVSPAQFDLLPELVSCWLDERSRRVERSRCAAQALAREQRRRDAEALSEAAAQERYKEEVARRRREAEQLEAAAQERRRSLLARLERSFEQAFLEADTRRASDPDGALVTDVEYDDLKARFVQRWARSAIDEDLDADQAAAVSAFGTDIQVVARAGSGKTRTLVTRALFLQLHCGVPPGRILLLAFNRDAKDEIRARLSAQVGDELPHVLTFHALAYAIVHPREKLLLDDSALGQVGLSREIHSLMEDYIASGGESHVRSLMLCHFREDCDDLVRPHPDAPASEHDRLAELAIRRSLRSEALDGTYVKSYGEKLIANVLFEHGIEYQYEKAIGWGENVYHPDFTIAAPGDGGVVIEYLGLSGNPAYDAQTESKRRYWHEQPKWTLIELTPADIAQGEERFTQSLLTTVAQAGFRPRRRTDDEIWSLIRTRTISRFTGAVTNFIGRCRALGWGPARLKAASLKHQSATAAEQQFLDAATAVLERYETLLNSPEFDDFNGLIWRAVSRITAGATKLSYGGGSRDGDLNEIEHVLVDEFQDFSLAFFDLVKAIGGAAAHTDLYVVGDDWQAINGFAGSDLRYFQDFAELFPGARRLMLTTNYRSTRSIVEAGNIVMNGRGQHARSAKPEMGEARLLYLDRFRPTSGEEERHRRDQITPALLRLVAPHAAAGGRVEVLMRTNQIPADVALEPKCSGDDRGLDRFTTHLRSFLPAEHRARLSVSTAHKAKGLERAAVVVFGATASAYPKLHPTWPFYRVFGQTPWTLTEDERRLFYVALTRAESFLAVVTNSWDPSPFVKELKDSKGLSELLWRELPPAPSADLGHVEIRVFRGYGARDALKESGFKFISDDHGKYWRRSLPAAEFAWEAIAGAAWNDGSVQVEVVDGCGQSLKRR